MDNGTVRAIRGGSATITAFIEVNGVAYTDTCNIEVSIPEFEGFDLQSIWDDEALFIKRDYTDDTRQTYINGGESFSELQLVANPLGEASTIYLDFALDASMWDVDLDNYDYFVEINIAATEGEYAEPNTFDIVATGSNNAMLSLERSVNATQTGYNGKLVVKNPNADRLFGFQIKRNADAIWQALRTETYINVSRIQK